MLQKHIPHTLFLKRIPPPPYQNHAPALLSQIVSGSSPPPSQPHTPTPLKVMNPAIFVIRIPPATFPKSIPPNRLQRCMLAASSKARPRPAFSTPYPPPHAPDTRSQKYTLTFVPHKHTLPPYPKSVPPGPVSYTHTSGPCSQQHTPLIIRQEPCCLHRVKRTPCPLLKSIPHWPDFQYPPSTQHQTPSTAGYHEWHPPPSTTPNTARKDTLETPSFP